MADVGDGGKRHIPTPMSSNFRRDLLQLHRFMSVNHLPVKVKLEETSEEDEGELELTLGLSMNGRFGVDPRAKKIKRTSSIPEFMNHNPILKDEETAIGMPMGCGASSLVRTCSLPTATEEEWRRRKELQTLRRLEARRKRSEKQRNLRVVRERNREDDVVVERDATQTLTDFAGSRAPLLGGGLPPPGPPSFSKASNGSDGISESESHPASDGEQKSTIASGTLIAGKSGKTGAVATRIEDNKIVSPKSRTKDMMKNMLEEMPCVSTKGKGPNGKRVQGFLYRYRKGEEVRILCVCHGSFLTPAEFVKHAGGGDVDHPLKHIVVSPSFL
ncbi:ninja-family protein AFP3 isoform X2 [Prosopis cineraria]|uniref:ninja-family protein AFP3 isoform X2 n=1 Tax=Prosopis cineraria TaxID=364024 RepID=UPI0024102291|nr:ninja-family protein AFP3 isoform X2 [Prosopis cineraria]